MTDNHAVDLALLRDKEEKAFAARDYAALADALEPAAALYHDPAEKAGTLHRAAMAALRAGQKDRGLELLARVTGAPDWERLARLTQLELLFAAEKWAELIAVLDRELADGGPWPEVPLRLEKARVLAFRLGRVEDAGPELDAVLQKEPDCRLALWMKLHLALKDGARDQTAAIYQKLIALAEADPDAKLLKAAALRLAQIQEFRFKDPGQAQAAYQKLGTDQAALVADLARFELDEAAQQWDQADRDLSALLAKLSPEEAPGAVPLALLQARIKQTLLGDPQAAGAILRALAEQHPRDLAVLIPATENALESGPPELKLQMAGKLLEQCDDPQEKARLAARIMLVQLDDLKNPQAAVEAGLKWRELEPGHPHSGRWLAEALVRAGKYPEAIKELDGLIADAHDPKDRQALLAAKAEIVGERLQDHGAALEALKLALDADRSSFFLIAELIRQSHRAGQDRELAAALEPAAALLTDPTARGFHRLWLARLELEKLGRTDEAAKLYEELLAEDPANRCALHAMARISREQGDWPKLARTLEQLEPACSGPATKAELKSRLAWLYETRLDRLDQARAILAETAGSPHSAEARRRFAYRDQDLAAYARVLAELCRAGTPGRLHSARLVRLGAAHEVLGELAEARAAFEQARGKLIDPSLLHLAMIDLALIAGDRPKSIGLTEDFARQLADPSKKALLWEAAWAKGEAGGPQNLEAMLAAFKSLEELEQGWPAAIRGRWLAAAAAGDAKTRADLFARQVKAAGDQPSLPFRLKLGYVLRDELGVNEESIAVMRQALTKDPKSAPLIRELELMYEQAGQWSELIRMMLLEIPLRKEPELLTEIYARLAGLYEQKFKAVDEAIKCVQVVLRLAPKRLAAHRDLIRLLEARSRWEETVKAVVACQEIVADPRDKVDLFVKAAQLLDEKIKDPNRAIQALKRALDLDPTRPETFAGLSRIYEREQQWQGLIDVLSGQAARVVDPAGKAAILEQIAEIQEKRMAAPDAAIQTLIQARDLDPERRSVLAALERLFQAAGQWPELVDVLERLAVKADDAGKIGYLCRIAALWDEKLAAPDRAIDGWERVRALDPNHLTALESLIALYERGQNFQLFVERALALAALVGADPARAVSLYCRAGQAREQRLQDDAGATDAYRRAMELDRKAAAPLALAKALHQRRQEWPQVVDVLLREELTADSPQQRLAIFTEIGLLRQGKLNDVAGASMAYGQALALKPNHLPAARPQAEIFFHQQEWAKARPLYEIWTTGFSDEIPDQRAEIWRKAGWCAEQAGDLEPALARYGAALQDQPNHRVSLERLSELHVKHEKWTEAAAVTERLLAVVKAAQDASASLFFLNRMGLVEERLGRIDRAAAFLEEALTFKPGDYETLKKLIELQGRLQNWNKVLACYDLAIKSSPTVKAQAENLVGKALVLDDQLGQQKSALAHYQAAFARDPENLVAWSRGANILFEQKSWPDAETALKNALRLEPDRTKQLDLHFKLGRVSMDGLANLPAARDQFEAALAIDPHHVPAMESLLDLYLKLEEWQKFIDAAEKFVKSIDPAGQAQLIPLFFKMAAVYRDHLQNTERAIISLQQVTRLNPDHQEARAELAALFISDPKFVDQAKAENLNLIRMKPFRQQSYRDLANIYKSQHNLDAMFTIYAIMKILGNLDMEEEMFYEANAAKVKHQSKRQLKEIDRQGFIIHPDEKGVMREMLVASGEYLLKQFPPPMEKYGAKKSNLLGKDSQIQGMDLIIELVHNLGFEGNLSIYLNSQLDEPVIMSAGENHVLVLNKDWLPKFDPIEQRFLIGRIIEHLINFHGIPLHHPIEPIVHMLAAIALAHESKLQFQVPGADPGEIENLKKIARKIIGRKSRTQVEHIAQRFSPEALNLDVAKWRKAMDHTANRAGLLACGDVTAAMNAIVKTDPRTKNLNLKQIADPRNVWEKNEYAVELLAYAVSDSYFRARERAGFSIVG